MMDPDGIANWSVTHVDWSEGKWHPKAYRAKDVTYKLLKNITVCACVFIVWLLSDVRPHHTSNSISDVYCSRLTRATMSPVIARFLSIPFSLSRIGGQMAN
jgi:hypothetical protein